MRVKNKTVKVITIGKKDILPNEVVDLPQEAADNPGVKLLLSRKNLVEIPDTMVDEVEETPEDLAENIKGMKKPELIEACKDHGIDTKGKTVAQLRQLLLEVSV
jgi:hypothetical protein